MTLLMIIFGVLSGTLINVLIGVMMQKVALFSV